MLVCLINDHHYNPKKIHGKLVSKQWNNCIFRADSLFHSHTQEPKSPREVLASVFRFVSFRFFSFAFVFCITIIYHLTPIQTWLAICSVKRSNRLLATLTLVTIDSVIFASCSYFLLVEIITIITILLKFCLYYS